MKKNLFTFIKVAFIIIDLISVMFILSIFYPLVTDGFSVTPDHPYYKFENRTINFYIPINIKYYGIWAIRDVRSYYKILNGSQILLNNTQRLPNITRSMNLTLDIGVNISIINNIDRSMMFKNQNVNLSLIVTGNYALGTISFTVDTTRNFTWIAPIENFSYDENYSMISYGNYSVLDVPFSILTSPYLNGTSKVQSLLYVNSTLISSSNYNIILGKYYNGQANFYIPNNLLNFLLSNINYAYSKNTLEFDGLEIEFIRGF